MIATQSTVVSGLINGAVQRIPVTTINIPVPIGAGQRYVLASVFSPDYFMKVIAKRNIPPSWKLAVIDPNGQLIARSGETARLGREANPGLMAAARQAAHGQLRQASRSGVDTYYAFTHSPMSGWIVAISVPARAIEASARQAVMLAASGLLLALLCAAAAALLFGRRLAHSIRSVAAAATALGQRRTAPASRTGIAEFDTLHRSLAQADQRLSQAEAEREDLLQREKQARLVAEEQVRTRDDFLAMLSHELRNPLSGIVGAADLLRVKNASTEMSARAKDILARQARHLTRIVDDLLDLARLSRGKVKLDMRPVELSAVVASALEALRVAGKLAGHALHCDIRPVWVNADRTRLEQVVSNLVGNALKYTPEGGRVEVTLDEADGEARLVVRDTGVGIGPELMPRLFDIFVQGSVSLDRSQGGLGIGLALVNNLVKLHGGTIGAHSEGQGKGSSFTVRLPRLPAPAATLEACGPQAAPAGTTPSTVLVIEDNEDARHMLAAHLSASGYRVLEAADGHQGVTLALADRPSLAIVDIGLPGIDGYQVAERLRAAPQTNGITLIALTGYGQEADRERARAAGFDHHLVKPLRIEQLQGCLASV
ncbi:MAG: ATP-binding protein [Pseudomonadota bacterium]